MTASGEHGPGESRDRLSATDQQISTVDPRTGLALSALVFGVAFVLWRADAVEGYGPFAAIVAGVVWIAVWTLAVLGSGRPLVRRLTGHCAGNWESEVLAAIAGAAVLVACAAGLSVIGLFRPWPMLATVLAWAMAGAVDILRQPLPRPAVDRRIGPLIGLAGVAALIATAVSPFYDQWHQHLGFPWIWLQNGSIQSLPNDWYSFMPVNSSLLFAYGLETLGPWSAQILHWWSGIMTVLAVALLAKRSGARSSGIWAIWVFSTTPVILHLATTAGSDLVVAMFAAGAWIALLKTREDGANSVRWWAFAGACVGLAAGTKYIAFGSVAIPVAIGAAILHRPWRCGDSVRPFCRHCSVAFAAAAATFSPWAIRNFVATGNPLFPFANRLFKSSLHPPADSAAGFSTTLSGLSTSFRHIVSGLDLGSFEASIDGFPSIGFVYVALIVVIAVMWPELRRSSGAVALAAGAVAGVGFWLVTMHVSRYLVPVLVPAAAVLGASMAGLMERMPSRLRSAAVVMVGFVITVNLAGSVTPIGFERLGSGLGVVSIDRLLARWVSSTPAFETVAALEDQAKVLMVAEARALGFDRPVVFSDPYRDPLLLELARTSQGAEDLASQLQEMGVTHVLANRWEAVRSAQLRGNDRFFAFRDLVEEGRLLEFCGRCLDPIWNDSGLFLYRLVPDCVARGPGGAELATW
jgi:hypothetical protein